MDKGFVFAIGAGIEVSEEKIKAAAQQMLTNLKDKTTDKQLYAVRNAIKAFMPAITNLRVRRSPELLVSVEKMA
jgi:hypothetical protein